MTTWETRDEHVTFQMGGGAISKKDDVASVMDLKEFGSSVKKTKGNYNIKSIGGSMSYMTNSDNQNPFTA